MQYARNMHSICNMPAPGKKLFKEWIPDNHSVVVPEGITKCTDMWYQGTLYHYSIANVSLICQFHVLPIVFRDEHWLFHFTGNYLDFDNHMHLLTDFDKATKRLGLRLQLNGLRILLQCRRPGFDSWVGKIHWRRKWQPTPVFLPGESHGLQPARLLCPWDRKSWTRLSNSTTTTTERLLCGHTSCIWDPYLLENSINWGLRSQMTHKVKQSLCKLKPELHFYVQTDDDISLWLGIISSSPQNCNLESPPWGGCTTWDSFPVGTPDSCHSGLSNAAQVQIQVGTIW